MKYGTIIRNEIIYGGGDSGGESGSEITISADYTEGKKLATITVDDTITNIFTPGETREVTLAQYNALSEEEKMNGTVYLIEDAPAVSSNYANGVAMAAAASSEGSNIIKFGVNSEGKYGYYPPGADTLVPFSSGSAMKPGLYIDPIMVEIMIGVIE